MGVEDGVDEGVGTGEGGVLAGSGSPMSELTSKARRGSAVLACLAGGGPEEAGSRRREGSDEL